MADQIVLPTELPAPDNSGLIDLAGNIMNQLARADDPSSLYYRRPDLQAEAELRVKSILLRAGVSTIETTPEAEAARQYEQQWPTQDINPNLQALLDQNTAALEAAHGQNELLTLAAELRQKIGAAEYDRLVAEAGFGGATISHAQKADLPSLRVLASRGKYAAAAARAKR